jgi:hypothetical protein
MADRGNDHDATRNVGTPAPHDAGKTSGGGSLGHEQPREVEEQTNTRNNTGRRDDPVMPADDATLKTRI